MIVVEGLVKGLIFKDIGVYESECLEVGSFLGFLGFGWRYEDFKWMKFFKVVIFGSFNFG